MGSGSSRSRVAAYETLPADSQAYVHPADSFETKASTTAQSTGSSRKRPVTSSAASENNLQPDTEPSDAVRVRAGGRRPKPKEDAPAEPVSLPGGVNAKEDALQSPMPKKLPRTFKQGSPAPQMLASQQDSQSLPLPQPQPLHRRHIPMSRQIQEEEEPVPLHLRQQAEEKFAKPEERMSQEDAALAAIRAALPKPKARPTSSVETAATKAANASKDPLAQIASMQAGRAAGRQAKNHFPNVNVSISHRKVLLHWVKIARKRVIAIQNQAPQQRRKPKKPKPVRIDKLVELYLENEEELQRMCFEEPNSLILTQIELLTRRIDELDDEVDVERLRREAEMIGRKRGGSGGGDGDVSQAKAAADARREATQRLAQQQEFWEWETAFDSAVTNREAWKKNRGEREREAQANWRSRNAASWPAPMQAGEVQKRGKAEVAEQMKSERDRLKSLLAKFEAQKRREKLREEQPVLDQVEALQDEQRRAMAERAEELREQRAREAAEKKRRQEEAAERRRQAQEDRHRAEEEAKERELRKRLQEEEARRRREREAEEAERKRREEEERELERLRREKKESERKRAEERRAAEEREAQRRREIEERRRQEEERLAAERRKREEDEARQRQKEEEELRHAEQERRRQEEERRRQEEEDRQQAVSRAALLESAFDMLEEAADDEDEVGNDGDAGEQAWQAALSTLEEAPTVAADVAAEEPEEPPASPGGGADWMSRALGALDGADDSEDSDEEDEEAGTRKNADPRSDGEKLSTDMQFIKLAGAITKKIDQIHGE